MSDNKKSLAFVHRNDTRFAVGDFYPVLSVFSYHELGNTVSPFLLLDHLGPGKLLPSTKRRGVNKHPHRGFETVTLVYEGELEHQDSTGAGGVIQAGDVQWMTAASGVLHQELFSDAFSQSGGPFELIQLWVNLPAKHKMDPAKYQNLESAHIPRIELADGAGIVRVIAGQYDGIQGAAQTHTPMGVFDVQINAGHQVKIKTGEGDTALIYVRTGRLDVGADELIESQSLAVMSAKGDCLVLKAAETTRLLVLTGEPIHEPINGHGPFVMNNYDEILQAYDDIKHDRFV